MRIARDVMTRTWPVSLLLVMAAVGSGAAQPRLDPQGPAQSELAGRVVDQRTRAPIAGAVVALGATEATADRDGYFVLRDVPRGSFELVVVADGYEPLVQRVRAGAPQTIELVASSEVSGSELITIEEAREIDAGGLGHDVGRDALRTLPGSGNDALKSLQSLPGTARVPFGLGGLVLRGFSPRDSNVFLDGIEVPVLFHFGGLASFFPSTMIDSLELVSSGYGVRYGRGQGGLVDIRSRNARTDRWAMATELSFLDASVMAEGPVGGGGVTIGLRRSFVDAVLAAVPISDLSLAPRYLDSQVRWQSRSGTWTALLFGADDGIALNANAGEDTLDARQSFVRAGVRYRKRHGNLELTALPWIGFDRTTVKTDDDRTARTNVTVATRVTLQNELASGFVAGGLDLQGNRYSYQLDNEPPDLPAGMMPPAALTGRRWAADLGAWAEYAHRFAGGKLSIQPGLRGERLGLTGEWVLDPRLTLRQQITPAATLIQTLGRYHQPPLATAVDYQLPDQPFRASHAWQASAGVNVVSARLGGDVTATAFGARLADLPIDVVTGATPLAAPNSAGSGGASAISRELVEEQFGRYSYQASRGRGRTYGVETLIRRRTGWLQGWISYTYARSFRQGDPWSTERYIPYVLDQPHVLTALATAPLGANWRIGARLRYATGNPITPTIGVDFDVAREEFVPIAGRALSDRLPAFAQLDLRVDRMWRRPWGSLKLFLDVQNVTNRVNPEGVTYSSDYSERSYTRGLPVFPSLGLEYTP
jgi:Carboxypeptidase regulatory-like domain/TonB-dependent Receptor Plug Domain